MKFALFDEPIIRQQLLPFTYTRPIAEIRWGILTITEKWEKVLESKASFITQDYLSAKFPPPDSSEGLLLVNGAISPDAQLLEAIMALNLGDCLHKDENIIAAKVSEFISLEQLKELTRIEYLAEYRKLERTWHIFKDAGHQIKEDFKQITLGKVSQKISDEHTKVYNESNIFIEEGVIIKAAVLDADNGPIYLGHNSTVEAGAIIKGPFSLGKGSTINGLAHMRGDISIGPDCKVGGEVSNSIIFGNSNKGHDGFMGNSVLGEWCNIGAGTNTSNLKNNYAKVKVWDFSKGGFINTGEQFCGLMMGDHSKSGIGTMFNTGTTIGVAANIFGSGFPRTFIPSFSWGGHAGFTTFNLIKVKQMAEVSMARRNHKFDETEESILKQIFSDSATYRNWEI